MSNPDRDESQGAHDLLNSDDDICFSVNECSLATCTSAQKSAALFLLTLKEKYRLTQTALNFAVGQVKHMVGFMAEDMQAAVQSEMIEMHTTAAELPEITSCFQNFNPFAGLETEYQQTKFYVEHFDLVVSINTYSSACIFFLDTTAK